MGNRIRGAVKAVVEVYLVAPPAIKKLGEFLDWDQRISFVDVWIDSHPWVEKMISSLVPSGAISWVMMVVGGCLIAESWIPWSRFRRKTPLPAIAATESFRCSVGGVAPYKKTHSHANFHYVRHLNLRIENTHSREPLRQCKVQIVEIVPAEYQGAPWIIKEDFALAAGDSIFIPFISYGEYFYTASGDSFMEVLISAPYKPKLSAEKIYEIKFKITSVDAPAKDYSCFVWTEGYRIKVSETNPTAVKG